VRHTLVVASSNRGKLDELRVLLAELPLDVRTLAEMTKVPPTIVEDGATFVDNAIKKARIAAEVTMALSLGDDSGLEVDVLEGRPGVLSARFAHERATDAENNAALRHALDALGDPDTAPSTLRGQDASPKSAADPLMYKARFHCVLALVDPYADDGAPIVAHGTCEGNVTRSPRGSGGFGYDPMFLVDGTSKTMAELTAEEKNGISHRARAFRALVPRLKEVIAAREAVIAKLA
jgi:XTP/dITP diphosphohydrolase